MITLTMITRMIINGGDDNDEAITKIENIVSLSSV
jgi:hypothetical protein